MNSRPASSFCPPPITLMRKNPCALLSSVFAIALLLLAWNTTQNICYDQLGSRSIEIDNETSLYCSRQCDDDVASKKFAFIDDPQAAALSRKQFGEEDPTLRIKRVVICSWAFPTTNSLFRTFARSAVLWVFLELFLTAKRKYPFLLNMILLLIIGLGLTTAIYQLRDIHNRTCSPITFSDDYDASSADTICTPFLFKTSFILTIALLILMWFHFIYNCVHRRPLNEERYDNISQGTNPTHDNIALV